MRGFMKKKGIEVLVCAVLTGIFFVLWKSGTGQTEVMLWAAWAELLLYPLMVAMGAVTLGRLLLLLWRDAIVIGKKLRIALAVAAAGTGLWYLLVLLRYISVVPVPETVLGIPLFSSSIWMSLIVNDGVYKWKWTLLFFIYGILVSLAISKETESNCR